jgi:hypothetical protein
MVHLMRKEPITAVEQDGRPTVQMKLIEVTRDNVADNPGEW